jgi:hypothetical protein
MGRRMGRNLSDFSKSMSEKENLGVFGTVTAE